MTTTGLGEQRDDEHYVTVQYNTVQYSTVQYSTVQYSTVQYSTLHCVALHEITDLGEQRDDEQHAPDETSAKQRLAHFLRRAQQRRAPPLVHTTSWDQKVGVSDHVPRRRAR